MPSVTITFMISFTQILGSFCPWLAVLSLGKTEVSSDPVSWGRAIVQQVQWTELLKLLSCSFGKYFRRGDISTAQQPHGENQ